MERLSGLDWGQLTASERVVSRDMEVFYPVHRYLNFYVMPLHLEKPVGRRAEVFEREMVGHAVILRDITENRRSTEEITDAVKRMIAENEADDLTVFEETVATRRTPKLDRVHLPYRLRPRTRRSPARRRPTPRTRGGQTRFAPVGMLTTV